MQALAEAVASVLLVLGMLGLAWWTVRHWRREIRRQREPETVWAYIFDVPELARPWCLARATKSGPKIMGYYATRDQASQALVLQGWRWLRLKGQR